MDTLLHARIFACVLISALVSSYLLTNVFASIPTSTQSALPSSFPSHYILSKAIKIGNSPREVAINPATNRVYVTNGDTVSMINATDNTIIHNTSIEPNLWGIAVNPAANKVYVTSPWSKSVIVLDGASDYVLDQIKLDTAPLEIAVNPKTNKVYATTWNFPNGGFYVIDGSTDRVISKVLDLHGSSYGVAVNPQTNRIYINNYNPFKGAANTVSVIDGNSDTVIASITTGYGRGDISTFPDSLRIIPVAVNIKTNTVYATFQKSFIIETDKSPQILDIINGSTNKVIANVSTVAVDLAPDPVMNYLYIDNFAEAYTGASPIPLLMMNGTTNKISDPISNLPDVAGGDSTVFNPSTSRIYVAAEFLDAIIVIQRTTNISELQSPLPTEQQLESCKELSINQQNCNDVSILIAQHNRAPPQQSQQPSWYQLLSFPEYFFLTMGIIAAVIGAGMFVVFYKAAKAGKMIKK